MSDWVITGIYHATSAYWLTADRPTDVALTGATVERPNQVLANPLCVNPGPAPSCWINPAAFASPALGTFGNLGKNNIPGPAFWQIDLAIAKEFRCTSNHKIEFRAEAFNLTNSFRAGIPQAAGASGLAAGGSGVSTTFGTSDLRPHHQRARSAHPAISAEVLVLVSICGARSQRAASRLVSTLFLPGHGTGTCATYRGNWPASKASRTFPGIPLCREYPEFT